MPSNPRHSTVKSRPKLPSRRMNKSKTNLKILKLERLANTYPPFQQKGPLMTRLSIFTGTRKRNFKVKLCTQSQAGFVVYGFNFGNPARLKSPARELMSLRIQEMRSLQQMATELKPLRLQLQRQRAEIVIHWSGSPLHPTPTPWLCSIEVRFGSPCHVLESAGCAPVFLISRNCRHL